MCLCRKFSCTSCRFFLQNYEIIYHNSCTCRKIFHMARNIPAQPHRFFLYNIHMQEVSCTCRKKQQNVQSLLMPKINVSYLNENMLLSFTCNNSMWRKSFIICRGTAVFLLYWIRGRYMCRESTWHYKHPQRVL